MPRRQRRSPELVEPISVSQSFGCGFGFQAHDPKLGPMSYKDGSGSWTPLPAGAAEGEKLSPNGCK